MEEEKFKVGDRVRVTRLAGLDRNYDVKIGDEFDITVLGDTCVEGHKTRPMIYEQIERVVTNANKNAKILPPKFILQYEKDVSTLTMSELFATEKEVRTRIQELAANSQLKRDSIKVYDIKRVRNVKLGVKITISK